MLRIKRQGWRNSFPIGGGVTSDLKWGGGVCEETSPLVKFGVGRGGGGVKSPPVPPGPPCLKRNTLTPKSLNALIIPEWIFRFEVASSWCY